MTSDNLTTILSFLFFLVVFVIIGALSAIKKQRSTSDYLVASQSVKPWLAGLSGVATNNSGYLFIGMIGYTYVNGLSSIWQMIGWLLGDFVGSYLVMRSMRVASGEHNIQSFGELVSRWWGQHYKILQRFTGILIIIFLGSYIAAQLIAGSKALHTLFDWSYGVGAIIGAVMVLIYSFAGGLRASIWTDAAQSFVMIGSLMLLFFYALAEVGGWSSTISQLNQVSPTYMNWFPAESTSLLSDILFFLMWFFFGLGMPGQPHIVVRYMSLDDPQNLNRLRFYYYLMFILFYIAAIMVGLLTRLLLNVDVNSFDFELALPTIAVQLLPAPLVGLMLAGLFAATMSTADSLVISCSASISKDLFPDHPFTYTQTKLTTLTVVLIAMAIALAGPKGVFSLVLLSWGLLAAAFVPLTIIYSLNYRPSQWHAITTVVSGIVIYLGWPELGLSAYVHEMITSMLGAGLVFLIFQMFRHGQMRPVSHSIETKGDIS